MPAIHLSTLEELPHVSRLGLFWKINLLLHLLLHQQLDMQQYRWAVVA